MIFATGRQSIFKMGLRVAEVAFIRGIRITEWWPAIRIWRWAMCAKGYILAACAIAHPTRLVLLAERQKLFRFYWSSKIGKFHHPAQPQSCALYLCKVPLKIGQKLLLGFVCNFRKSFQSYFLFSSFAHLTNRTAAWMPIIFERIYYTNKMLTWLIIRNHG